MNQLFEIPFFALYCVLFLFLRSGKPKIKVYRDENGAPKGDALCTYVKVESVELALTIIDGCTMHSKVRGRS